MDLQASNDSDLDNVTVKVRVVQHSEEEEVEPEEATTPQKPSGCTANQSTHEDEVSSDETQTEELDLPKSDSGVAYVEKDKKPNKKNCNGAIPKTTKKSVPAPKSAPNSNQSTPKTARKGTLIQDNLLVQFVNEATDLSHRVDRTITAWEARDGRASLRKKTATSLERMRGDLQDRLNDVNETGKKWKTTMTATR